MRFKRRRMLRRLNYLIYGMIFGMFTIVTVVLANDRATDKAMMETQSSRTETFYVESASASENERQTLAVAATEKKVVREIASTTAAETEIMTPADIVEYEDTTTEPVTEEDITEIVTEPETDTTTQAPTETTTPETTTPETTTPETTTADPGPQAGSLVAVYVEDGSYVNMRADASTDSQIVGQMSSGATGQLIQQGDTWSQLVSGGITGYVHNDYLLFGEDASDYDPSVTAQPVPQDTTAAETESQTDVEEEKQPEEENQPQTQPVTEKETEADKEIQEQPSTSVAKDDAYLLACITWAEAGSESYQGQLAVANVVMNRVRSSLFPNNIYDVVYQTGQFAPTWDGALNTALANGPTQSCISAANAALAGDMSVPSHYLYFMANWAVDTSTLNDYKVIDNQTYWAK